MTSRLLLATAVMSLVSVSTREASADLYQLEGTIGSQGSAGGGVSIGPISILANGSFSGTFTFPSSITGPANINEYLSTGALFDTLTLGFYSQQNYLGEGYDIVFFVGSKSSLYLTFATPFTGAGSIVPGGSVSSFVDVSSTVTGGVVDGLSAVDTATSTFLSVPEPSTLALMAIGGAIALAARRKLLAVTRRPTTKV
jgi:hypothetical protein